MRDTVPASASPNVAPPAESLLYIPRESFDYLPLMPPAAAYAV